MQSPSARLVLLTGFGAFLGLLIALYLIQNDDAQGLPLSPDVAATVEGHSISTRHYHAVLEDLAADSKDPLSAEDRQFALDRLIDEELLVLRGSELNLERTHPEVRKAVASALISSIVNKAEAQAPDDATLRSFYADNHGYFALPPSWVVQWIRRPVGQNSDSVIQEILATLQGDQTLAGLTALGFERVDMLPERPLGLEKIRDYLGPTMTETVERLSASQWSKPLLVGDWLNVLYVTDVQPGSQPEFEDIQSLIENEFRRRQGEAALRHYLQDLRADRDIRVNTDLVESK